jgi:hypothetical protein
MTDIIWKLWNPIFDRWNIKIIDTIAYRKTGE